ncbi:protoporphyrinogen oxidase [Nocardioides marinquilinus]|uniref:Protoporphyrinogen oxidase n=1 Tax=Nocardioides marinquilinus TaxID=1210400 RepID=A0ABP9Q1X2_9ACTN
MRAVVVGGGVAGLVAARDLTAAGHEVVVLEATDRAGGKIRRAQVGGATVDVGAEAMVNRRADGVGLARELGLDVVHPVVASSRVWTRGALRPLPRTLLGWPLDLDGLAASGVLSDEGRERALAPRDVPAGDEIDDDVAVGDLVAARFGDEVVERLTEPLLGGVYAGRARGISTRAAAPVLLDLARGADLPVGDPTVPVFAATRGGMGALVERLADGLDVRTGVTVRSLRRTAAGFEVAGERADAVVLAVPAAPAARLLADLAPGASAELAAVEYASVAVVTLAFAAADVPDAVREASGFLVPPVDGRRIKASTFTSSKWGAAHVGAGDDVVLLRTSVGRLGEERLLQRPDDDLVAASLADLHEAVGLAATPVDALVQRWGGGLPQYPVGHLGRVARVRADVARTPGLAVCGAAYDGVGVAACIASGRAAARDVAP